MFFFCVETENDSFAAKIKLLSKVLYMNNKENLKRIYYLLYIIFCYLLVDLCNKFTNSLKLDLGIYLVGAGASCTAIDTLANIDVSRNCFS